MTEEKKVVKIPQRIKNLPTMKIPSYESKDFRGREIMLCKDMKRHVDAFKEGRVMTPTETTILAKIHGCRHCPYYGSTMCYHYTEVIPPKVHSNRICGDRWNEIMSYAVQSQSYHGKVARRTEILEKIGNHITLLEANLADYRQKRMAKITNQGTVPLESLSHEQVKFDDYEMGLLAQIEKLAAVFADQLLGELRLEKKSSTDNSKMNLQQFNIQIHQAATKLEELTWEEQRAVKNAKRNEKRD